MNVAASINNLRQQTPEQLLAQATHVLPPWVAILLVVALAWKLGQLTWLLVPIGDADPVVLLPPASGSDPGSNQALPGNDVGEHVRSITRTHLFGEHNAPVVNTNEPPPEDAAVTSLDLKLIGTVVAGEESESIAVIENGRGEALVLGIGDAVQDGVSLRAVYATEAHILNRGKLESIPLPREVDRASGSPQRRTTSRSTRRAPASNARTGPAAAARSLAANPQKLTELIRPQPVFSEGKQLGYRVYPGRNRQQFSRLGLKPGDLVTQINGSALDDPAKGLEIFRALEDSSQVSVTVERNGESQVLVLDTSVLGDLSKNQR